MPYSLKRESDGAGDSGNAAPEPSFVSKSRPAVGFLALLNDEQKRLLLSVNVNDCLGSKDDI
jgi:hypothetical protein